MKTFYLISLFLMLAACGKPAEDSQSPEAARTSPVVAEAYEAPAPSKSYSEAHAAAVTAIEYSVERGHAWSTADDLLKEAVAADEEGDDDAAMKLADRARVQAELAVRQADVEEATWRMRVLSN
jgi:hypothetical protein